MEFWDTVLSPLKLSLTHVSVMQIMSGLSSAIYPWNSANFDLGSRSWPDPKRSCCISVDPYGQPERIYGVFIALACLFKKVLPKNSWGPVMTWNDLGDMMRGHWLQYSDSGCFFRMFFVQKRCLSIFWHWLIIERSQTWLDLGSPTVSQNSILVWVSEGKILA